MDPQDRRPDGERLHPGSQDRPALRGRGTPGNPPNRFESLAYERARWSAEDPSPATEFLRDMTRSILSRNESPDVGFDASINPYRGCEHGCVYCFARPNHEYLGFSAGLDFETRIMVKEDAPDLLRAELASSSWRPQTIALSGVTDPYQPIERRLGLTRRCLEVLADCRNPAVVITKSNLVARDIDILAHMASWDGSAVFLSITTLDADLSRRMEPRAPTPSGRLEAVRALADAGVPTGVLVAPVIPGLTDHELPSILGRAGEAGARFCGYVPLRLPYGVEALFEQWLTLHEPAKKKKILARLRSMRGGRLNDPGFGSRMRGRGAYAAEIRGLYLLARRKSGLAEGAPNLSVSAFRKAGSAQGHLFE